jgi:hypothetical protein
VGLKGIAVGRESNVTELRQSLVKLTLKTITVKDALTVFRTSLIERVMF